LATIEQEFLCSAHLSPVGARQDTEWLQTEFAVSLDFCAVFRGLRWGRLGGLFDLLFNQESVRQPDYVISLLI
jgi:hypothetical protein